MFKKLTERLFKSNVTRASEDGFFLNVCCDECREEFDLFINKAYELMQNFKANGSVTYSLRKEVIGVGCKNRIFVTMLFDGGKNLVSKEIENGEFIEK